MFKQEINYKKLLSLHSFTVKGKLEFWSFFPIVMMNVTY